MFALSKVIARGIPIGLTLIVFALTGGITSLQALPTCPAGTIVQVGPILMVTEAQLASGVCVQSGDKLYGNWALDGIPSAATFNFVSSADNTKHLTTFNTTFLPGTTTPFSYEVEVLPGGTPITELDADFFNAGGTTTLQQTTNVPMSGTIDFSKTGTVGPPVGVNRIFFTPEQDVTDMMVSGTLTTDESSIASQLFNVITEEIPVPTPEPAALELFGIALTGLGVFGWRRKSSK